MKLCSGLLAKFSTVAVLTMALLLALAPSANASPRHPIVVSLGDSYSSGEGIPPFYGNDDPNKYENSDWLAHRSMLSWPGLLSVSGPNEQIVLRESRASADNDWSGNWYFAAASGAKVCDLASEQQIEIGNNESVPIDSQLAVFDAIPESQTVDYVTMTLGGNDLGFVEVVEAAAMNNFLNMGRLDDELRESRRTWGTYEKGTQAALAEAYREIDRRADHKAHIIVAGYPLLFDERAFLLPSASSTHYGTVALIDSYEAHRINENVKIFNKEFEALVEGLRTSELPNLHFVSVETAFEGHGAYSLVPYINPISVRSSLLFDDVNKDEPISTWSLHPNVFGACAYKSAVQAEIDSIEERKHTPEYRQHIVDEFVKEYYTDWTFEHGEMIIYEGNRNAAVQKYVQPESAAENKLQQHEERPFAMLSVRSCSIDPLDEMGYRYRVTIEVSGTQNNVMTEEMWEHIQQEDALTISEEIVVNDSNLIEDIQTPADSPPDEIDEVSQVPGGVDYSIDSPEEARSYIVDRLSAAGQFIPPEIDVTEYQEPHDSSPGGYSAHGYTNVRDEHIVSAFFWTVTEDGQVYDTLLGRYLDLETMQ